MEDAKTIVVGNRAYRPLLDETLTNDDLRVAREELNETPESREIVLKKFKKMLCDQDEFVPRTDDVFLLRFLRCRKFDCERAFNSMRDLYKFRSVHPKVFPSPSGIEYALRSCIFNFLPHRDHRGRAIYIVKLGRWDLDKISYADFVAAGNLVAEYVLDNSVTQINGYVGICDCKGFTLKHFFPFCSPKHMMLLTTLMQERFPARFKIAYIVNCHSLINAGWNLFKPLMKEKFRHRIQILGSDIKELHQFIDPRILPPEFGGSVNTEENKEIAQRVLDKESYFNFNQKFGFY